MAQALATGGAPRITPAPAPKGITGSTGGNSPRGVATPRLTPTVNDRSASVLDTGANPRGTVIPTTPLAPTVNDRQAMREHLQAAAQASVGGRGGALTTGSIGLPQSVLHGALYAGGILGNLEKDITGFPKGLASGLYYGSDAIRKSIEQGSLNPIGHFVGQAAASDPLVNVIEGNFSKAAQLAEQHPLNAILDATGAEGVVGRAVGAGARLGGVASADLARTREISPELPGTTVQDRYSRDYFRQQLQRRADQKGTSGVAALLPDRTREWLQQKNISLPGTPENTIRKQVASQYGTDVAMTYKNMTDRAKELKSVKPSGKEERRATLYPTAFGSSVNLDHLLQSYQDVKAGAYGQLTPSAAKTLDEHIKNLDAAVNKPNLNQESMTTAAENYRTKQAQLEADKIRLGLNEEPELARHLENQYAVSRMQDLGAKYINDTSAMDPAYRAERAQARAETQDAAQQLENAKIDAKAEQQAHVGASRAVADLQRRIPVHPATDALANHALDLRSMIEQTREATKADHANRIAVAKDALQAAKGEQKIVESNPRHLEGLMIQDDHAPLITQGKYAGQRLRPLTSEEVRAHMRENGDEPAYMRMVNPYRGSPLDMVALRGDKPPGSFTTGKGSTGQAALTGDMPSGWEALTNSQLNDIRQIGHAQAEKNFVDRFSLKDPTNGETRYMLPHEAEQLAQEFEARTGLKMQPFRDATIRSEGNVTLIPKVATDELSKQYKYSNPGSFARGAMKLNKALRYTVLPMSAKLPLMHPIEMGMRSVLAGATPLDYLRARYAIRAMKQAEAEGRIPAGSADRLMAQAVPGGLSGHLVGLDNEDLGRFTDRERTIANTLATPAKAWSATARGILKFQRWSVKPAEMAALGIHMRHSLQDWGHGFMQAQLAVKKLADEVAKGYADPKTAESAANLVHHVMGQYSGFTARQRFFISRMSPFASWYKNAAAFTFHHLPIDHPLKSVMIQDVANTNAKQWNSEHSGLYADMRSYWPMGAAGSGHWLDAMRFTPIVGSANPYQEAGSLLFPAEQSAALGYFGLDAFGNPLKLPGTAYGKQAISPESSASLVHALEAGAESFTGPATGLARAIEGRGSSLYSGSMPLFDLPHALTGVGSNLAPTRVGSAHGATGILGGFARQFNPLYGVYLNAGSSTSSPTSSTSFGGGGNGPSFSSTPGFKPPTF